MAKRSNKKSESQSRHADWLWGLLLFAAVALAYTPVTWAGYIWDDDVVFLTNPVIVGPLGLKEIWTTSAADICPLTLTTFWVEHKLWGLGPLPYHLVNVFLHGTCALILWRVLRLLLVPGAWLGAALWALHPVQVESVAWISEMKNTESGLFFLLAIYFFVKSLKDSKGTAYALTLLFAALAMASKSSTVILPVVLCLCAWWVEGRWHWRKVTKVAPILLMSVAAGIVSIWTQQLGGASDQLWSRSWPVRMAGAGDAVWFYLGKLVWPHPLLTIYPKWQIDAGNGLSYLPFLAVLIVLVVFWYGRQSWSRPWFFAFAYFLVALLPVLGLIDNYIFRYSVVFDHMQYLAGMGPLALAGAGLFRLANIVIPEKATLQPALAAGVLLVLGILTWNQACVYESKVTLWNHTLAGNPKSEEAYNNLGIIADQNGQEDIAMDDYQKALAANPDYPEAHYNLGLLLSRSGHADEAMAQYQRAVELYPDYPDAQNNLAILLMQKGRPDEAIAHYQKVLELNPDDATAHANLGVIYAQKGEASEALAQFQKALQISPDDAGANGNLGNFLLKQGQVDAAFGYLQKSLQLNPDIAEVHNNLGYVLMEKSRLDEAIAQFQEALRLQPGYQNAQNNLAKAQGLLAQKAAKK
jgi:tetratricopeptide (TPR) repeat protein